MATSATAFSFLRGEMRVRNLAAYVLVFAVYFGAAKYGLLFYTRGVLPVIWPPFGIALGAMLALGYRMWLPIALAELLAISTAGFPLPFVISATVAQTLQPLVGTWVMRRLQFDGRLSRIRDAFVLVGAAFTITAIAPTITNLTQIELHTLTRSFETVWTSSWSNGILGTLILTPLITTWFPLRPFTRSALEWAEFVLAFGALIAIVVLIVTPSASDLGLIAVYALLAILAWIAIRMEIREVTLALFLTACIGITVTALRFGASIGNQLFSDELFLEFIAVLFLVFSTLVEERKRARHMLERNVSRLSRALRRIEGEDAAKNQFIATLAHELRNPLSPVVSALDLLTLQSPSPEALHTIEGAQRELGVMRRLLDDILDIARVSQNTFRLQKEIRDVRSLLEQSAASTSVYLQNRRHRFLVRLPPDKVVLEVDPIRFQQMVVNLLNNAGKYTPSGGTIVLSCEKATSHALIRVKDTGIGIPPDSLQEIFEPFRQIHPSPHLGTGLGIGLWLTKRLVSLHGGSIAAESEGQGRGSTFTVSLPLREIIEEKEGGPSGPAPEIPPFAILVVDDNEAAALSMQKLLRLKGHTVEIAHDGASALSKAERFKPKVALLDIGLPDMSGYDLARAFKGRGSRAILVALTGYGQDEDKAEAKEAGFAYHLTKPVGIADIEAILAQITSH